MATDSDFGLHHRWQPFDDDLHAADGSGRSLIGDLACSLALLMLVAVAAWLVITAGAGQAPWH